MQPLFVQFKVQPPLVGLTDNHNTLIPYNTRLF